MIQSRVLARKMKMIMRRLTVLVVVLKIVLLVVLKKEDEIDLIFA